MRRGDCSWLSTIGWPAVAAWGRFAHWRQMLFSGALLLGTTASAAVSSASDLPATRSRWEAAYQAQIDAWSAWDQAARPAALPARADQVSWWHQAALAPQRPSARPVRLSLDELILRTLDHSLQVRILADAPAIRQTAIVEAQATFDPRSFVESKYINTNEPIGSTLTTGGPPRYRDSNWTSSTGLRRKTTTGGQFEIAERFGYRNNNSVFLIPKDQATARLALSFTQPLLNGAGQVYNTSVVVLAQIDAAQAEADFRQRLQGHLAEVTKSYWALYLERAHLALRQRLAQQAREVLAELEARRKVDVSAGQLVRARAALAVREAAVIRAALGAQNAESRVRVLVNDPCLGTTAQVELIPSEDPSPLSCSLRMRDSFILALDHRPEIAQAFGQLKSTSVRLQLAEKELLPYLALLLETYVSGLQGHSDVGQAFVDQFSVGQPSYTAGLTLDIPLGNRAAKARWQKQQLERRQALHQLRSTVESVLVEVEIAVRETATAQQEIVAAQRALVASRQQLAELQRRWELLPGEDQHASLYLEDLLGIHERLTEAELALLQAQVAFHAASVEWKRATGTLLEQQRITIRAGCVDGLPTTIAQGQRPAAARRRAGLCAPTARLQPSIAQQPAAAYPPTQPGTGGPQLVPALQTTRPSNAAFLPPTPGPSRAETVPMRELPAVARELPVGQAVPSGPALPNVPAVRRLPPT